MVKNTTFGFQDSQEQIYLSGPIRKSPDNGVGWREDVIADYGDEYNFHNPLDLFSPETHDILSDPIDYEENAENEQVLPSEYVLQDKVAIAESDYILVGLPEIIARGTISECMWGHCMLDKPFFVWEREGQKESGWLYDHAEVMHEDLDVVMREITNHE